LQVGTKFGTKAITEGDADVVNSGKLVPVALAVPDEVLRLLTHLVLSLHPFGSHTGFKHLSLPLFVLFGMHLQLSDSDKTCRV
jgi:hypothetical protein